MEICCDRIFISMGNTGFRMDQHNVVEASSLLEIFRK